MDYPLLMPKAIKSTPNVILMALSRLIYYNANSTEAIISRFSSNIGSIICLILNLASKISHCATVHLIRVCTRIVKRGCSQSIAVCAWWSAIMWSITNSWTILLCRINRYCMLTDSFKTIRVDSRILMLFNVSVHGHLEVSIDINSCN